MQWLLFGLVGIIGWWRLLQVESRREDEDGELIDPGVLATGEPSA